MWTLGRQTDRADDMANGTEGVLEERLKQLEDLNEIRQLYIDYGRHLDAGDAAAYASLFGRDAKLRLGAVMRADGREQILQVAQKTMRRAPDGSRTSVHIISSPRIEINGDNATGECVWTAVSISTGTQKIMVGRHIDELVREEGRWCFAKRRGLLDIGGFG
jgi:uncharacterized protein (TIGR02246 family)